MVFLSARGIILDSRDNTNVQDKCKLREDELDPGASLVSDRCAVSFDRLLQVVIVGQNLHEEVELQSLRLQDKNNNNNDNKNNETS